MLRYRFLPGNPGVTLFDAVCDMDNLRLAHQNASRGKSFYKEVKMVNSNPDYYLKQIQDSLLNRTFTTSPYNIFQRMEGEKLRTIYKLPYYPDRIVQWAILQIIGPIMERHFIYDTYSSIKGRGPIVPRVGTGRKEKRRQRGVIPRICLLYLFHRNEAAAYIYENRGHSIKHGYR